MGLAVWQLAHHIRPSFISENQQLYRVSIFEILLKVYQIFLQKKKGREIENIPADWVSFTNYLVLLLLLFCKKKVRCEAKHQPLGGRWLPEMCKIKWPPSTSVVHPIPLSGWCCFPPSIRERVIYTYTYTTRHTLGTDALSSAGKTIVKAKGRKRRSYIELRNSYRRLDDETHIARHSSWRAHSYFPTSSLFLSSRMCAQKAFSCLKFPSTGGEIKWNVSRSRQEKRKNGPENPTFWLLFGHFFFFDGQRQLFSRYN